MYKKIYLRGLRLRKASFYSCPIFLLLLCTVCLLSADCFAQATAFEPFMDDTRQLSLLLNRHQTSFKNNLDHLPAENRKDLSETFTKRWTSIQERFMLGEIYTEPGAQEYINSITDKIRNANPVLKNSEFTSYFSRSGVPNASSLGEGVILVNMGLLWRLQNESQLAFVLCHEIAHSYLAHGDKSIRDYVAKLNSKEFQQGLKTIKKQAYGKRESLDELTLKFSFDTRRHTRQHEYAADSMAVELLKKTGFDVTQALTALALLDTIDNETVDIESSLTSLFDHPNYPFQKRWLKKETGLLGGHAQLQQHEWADSLKTHPDCSKRIAMLAPKIAKPASQTETLTSKIDTNTTKIEILALKTETHRPKIEPLKSTGLATSVAYPQFAVLQDKARYESIEFDFHRANYSSCLFSVIQLLKTKNADPYLVTMTGKCLNKIYGAFKSHELSKVTDLPSPGFSSDYNLLCQFIQRLYAENVAAISYHFLLKNQQALIGYKPFQPVFEEASRNKQQ